MSINLERLDPAFYTYDWDASVVWEEEGNPFYVLRAGEMRIYATSNDGVEETLRTTSALESFGIMNDADLARWTDKGEEAFFWENNPWFEVHNEVVDAYSEPFHSLDEAIDYAVREGKNLGN